MTERTGGQAAVPAAPPVRRRGRRAALLAVVGGALAVAALVVFQPWKLVVDEVVDEAAPGPVASGSPGGGPVAGTGAPTEPASPSARPAAATRTLATGSFISHEHRTSGTVRLLALPDGRRVLRLEGLDTSNGPDLKVWVTDQAVVDGPSGWPVFDDGRYVDLGSLKGNKGNQNYAIPADARLDGLRSVSIWCDRFNVSFGAAELAGDLGE
jgi:hypothetical protein